MYCELCIHFQEQSQSVAQHLEDVDIPRPDSAFRRLQALALLADALAQALDAL